MLLPKILEWIAEIVRPVVKQIEVWVQAKTKPVAEHFILGTAADLLRSKPALVVLFYEFVEWERLHSS